MFIPRFYIMYVDIRVMQPGWVPEPGSGNDIKTGPEQVISDASTFQNIFTL